MMHEQLETCHEAAVSAVASHHACKAPIHELQPTAIPFLELGASCGIPNLGGHTMSYSLMHQII